MFVSRLMNKKPDMLNVIDNPCSLSIILLSDSKLRSEQYM